MGKNKNRQRDMASDTSAEEAVDAVEAIEAAPQEEVAAEEPLVDFDTWHAVRKHRIPGVHKKEILKADFQGRKVPMVATWQAFDEALKKYGVTLA